MSQASSGDGPYLLGLDYGTESARVGIFDTTGSRWPSPPTGCRLTHTRPGWAEQGPDKWWAALVRSTHEAMSLAQVGPARSPQPKKQEE